MGVNVGTLTRPVGPLPLWGWGALVGGGAIVLLAARGHPAAAAVVNPNVAAPAPPNLPPMLVPTGGTIYDPATGSTTHPVTISDVLGGGTLSDFIGKLGPDYSNFSFNSGDTGVSVVHAAQNVLDAQQAEIAQAAYYQAAATHDTNYFAALDALIASSPTGTTNWSWLFGNGPTPWAKPTPAATDPGGRQPPSWMDPGAPVVPGTRQPPSWYVPAAP